MKWKTVKDRLIRLPNLTESNLCREINKAMCVKECKIFKRDYRRRVILPHRRLADRIFMYYRNKFYGWPRVRNGWRI